MNECANKTVGAIVAGNWKTAAVFEKYGIDFCCGGKVAMRDACKAAGADFGEVQREIAASAASGPHPESDFNTWEPDALVTYIETKHHAYATEAGARLAGYLEKICGVHGEEYPELFEIRDLFQESVRDLTIHMKKEEFMLFPYIRKMVREAGSGKTFAPSAYGTVGNPIRVMEDDHEEEGNRFRRIAGLSHGYEVPADACATYGLTMRLLQEFESDLHKHIHLENNILFPKAIALEQALTGKGVNLQ